MRKPNNLLGAGMLLMALRYIAQQFPILPVFWGDVLMGASLGLLGLSLLFLDENRAARIRAWKRGLSRHRR